MAEGASESDAVLYEVHDGIAWMTINRPEARNALNAAVRAGLWAGIRRFVADDAAKVLVLTGSGDKAFCAGADIKEMAATALQVPPLDFIPQFGRNITVEKPTIAAVNGIAFAGGFLLTQFCDLVVAAEHAQFGITEAKVGRGAPWAAPLPWLIPPRVALELLMTGEPIDATRAVQIGFVNHVVPAADLHDRALTLAQRLRDNVPLSVRAAKAMVHAMQTHRFEQSEEIWRAAYESEDAQEGPRSFREKRPPQWKGR